jgi:hypothetical protein
LQEDHRNSSQPSHQNHFPSAFPGALRLFTHPQNKPKTSMKTKILTLTIAALLPATWALAQEEKPPRPPRDGERTKGEGPRDGQRPPGPMLIQGALDADKDGIISAEEIQGAPAALKKLDKNSDGKLTREELQPPPGGPRGDGPRDGERPPGGQRAGERPKGGPRDGERRQGGPRDGERPQGGPRDGEGKPPEGNRERPERGERGAGERPPAPPLIGALDADHDGTISAEEIEQSSEALAKLDQNKDGQLGPREVGGRPPQGPPRDGDKGGEKLPQ